MTVPQHTGQLEYGSLSKSVLDNKLSVQLQCSVVDGGITLGKVGGRVIRNGQPRICSARVTDRAEGYLVGLVIK
ncbi:hypothetical protein TNCT_384711 [Trichonephila clavata]|uniref:Uncharacterized protein n=1 Tax=Trichonephila clavata TaxID=2740835 RepID=A0A8X6M3I9_TRICU|nr:hypothetical protein TNCT_384711 [Trichonephila clavata]